VVPLLDRECLPAGIGKEQRYQAKVIVFATVLMTVLMLGTVAWNVVQVVNSLQVHTTDELVSISTVDSYTSRGPISINGNGGFTVANGVVGGSGTAPDPFIIAGWDIDAQTDTYGIRIESTDAHFIVRDCYVHNGSSFYGIYLYDCINGILEDNLCQNDYSGIAISSSRYITLINNTCESNFDGITLISSSNNTLSRNDCSATEQTGILLAYSSNNALSDNTCSNGFDGIYLYISDNNTLIGNTCDSNSWGGIDFRVACNNTLVNNICSHGWSDGIYLEYSSNDNEILANLVSGYSEYSVEIVSGSDNHILYNTFLGNVIYDPGHPEAYDDGSGNSWNSTDGHGNYWNDWHSTDSDMNGIVDDPYVLGGSAGARDNYPLTTPVDFEDPITQVVLAGGHFGEWYTSPYSLSFYATDAISGVNWTMYSIDSGPWQVWDPYSGGVELTEDGIHTVEYYSRDNAGRTEPVRNTTFKIDKTAPVTVHSLSGTLGQNQWYVTSVNLTLNSTDNLSGVNCTRYSIDGGLTWQLYSGRISVTADGGNSVKFYSQDIATNFESARTVTVYIDTAPPSLTFDLVNDSKFTSDSVVISWSSSDVSSGVNRTEWSLDGEAWQLSTGDSVSLTELTDGAHVLELRATDNAGNSIMESVSFRVNTNLFSMSGPFGPWLDVGLILVALAVIVLLVLLLRSRRRRAAASEPEDTKQA